MGRLFTLRLLAAMPRCRQGLSPDVGYIRLLRTEPVREQSKNKEEKTNSGIKGLISN